MLIEALVELDYRLLYGAGVRPQAPQCIPDGGVVRYRGVANHAD